MMTYCKFSNQQKEKWADLFTLRSFAFAIAISSTDSIPKQKIRGETYLFKIYFSLG